VDRIGRAVPEIAAGDRKVAGPGAESKARVACRGAH
jgi:hypothetical protein